MKKTRSKKSRDTVPLNKDHFHWDKKFLRWLSSNGLANAKVVNSFISQSDGSVLYCIGFSYRH
jgi:hypothetical protein